MLGEMEMNTDPVDNLPEVPALSPRESECLTWASRGKSSSDIGTIVGLSPRTVDSYLEKVCAKLRVRTRIEAVAIAVRVGLITPDPR